MKLDEATAILQESAKRLGGNPSRDRTERGKQVAQHKPTFDDLDKRFFALDFDRAMIDYIKAHRKAFYFDGMVRK